MLLQAVVWLISTLYSNVWEQHAGTKLETAGDIHSYSASYCESLYIGEFQPSPM